MRFSCDSTYDKFNNFDSFESLMHFSIDSQLNYLEKDPFLNSIYYKKGLNLEEGFNEAVIKQTLITNLITNYDKYHNHYQNDENIINDCLSNNVIHYFSAFVWRVEYLKFQISYQHLHKHFLQLRCNSIIILFLPPLVFISTPLHLHSMDVELNLGTLWKSS
jgi:hypothetical protein